MFVVIRFRVPVPEQSAFRERLRPALDILRSRPGLQRLELGGNADDPDLLALVTHWDDIGSYRRGIGGLDGKMYVQPVLAAAIDEPTAYVTGDSVDPADATDPADPGAPWSPPPGLADSGRTDESRNDHRGGSMPAGPGAYS